MLTYVRSWSARSQYHETLPRAHASKNIHKGRDMAVFGFDAYSPEQIANRVEESGVAKARLPLLATAMLGLLAGGFIAIGSLYYTIVASDATLGFAATRVL